MFNRLTGRMPLLYQEIKVDDQFVDSNSFSAFEQRIVILHVQLGYPRSRKGVQQSSFHLACLAVLSLSYLKLQQIANMHALYLPPLIGLYHIP